MNHTEVFQDISLQSAPVSGSLEIRGIAYDSRRVQPGYLFAALPGQHQDGLEFIPQAVARGCSGVLAQKAPADTPVPCFLVSDVRSALGQVAANFYGNPIQKLKSAAVTGTSGKTTITYLVDGIFRQDGAPSNIIGTIRYLVMGAEQEAPHTTPEAPDLNRLLSEMVQAGAKRVVMEVSSHALVQGRVNGLAFDAAIFTNLSRDHLDYHKTEEDYYQAKKRLFTQHLRPGGTAVVNRDSSYGSRLSREIAGHKVLTYGLDGKADIYPMASKKHDRGLYLKLSTPWGLAEINSRLLGTFNIYNIMAAAGAGLSLGYSPVQVETGIAAVGVIAGRLEPVETADKFTVLVDYAHKPDALENVLHTLRELKPRNLICVFGCGGDRDAGKRPLMGKVAQHLSDYLIITSDNPRSEDPLKIIQEIMRGITENGNVETIPDRAQAIGAALTRAKKGDIVVIAGKGHETYQIIGATRHPFDDREVAREWLKKL